MHEKEFPGEGWVVIPSVNDKNGRCDSGNCAEILPMDGGAALRSTLNPDGEPLFLNTDEIRGLIASIQDGSFGRIVGIENPQQA